MKLHRITVYDEDTIVYIHTVQATNKNEAFRHFVSFTLHSVIVNISKITVEEIQ